MNPRLKAQLTRAGSFVLAGGLLYLALRGVDFETVGRDLREANYWWIGPIIGATLLSHLLRAWRWTFLLDQIPPREKSRPVSLTDAFGSLMIGYMANYVAPRVGELVRTANVSRRYRQPFASVLGTVITERILDVFTMALAMLTLPLVFAGQLGTIRDLLLDPVMDRLPHIPFWIYVVGTAVMGALAYLLYRWLATGHWARFAATLGSLRDGLATIWRTPRKAALVVSTVAMWFCYGLMAYLPFVMFGFNQAFDVGLVDAWGIMLLGAIGVVIPSPGGIGSYHYITIQVLVLLFAFTQDAAASYAILTHTGQMLIYVVTGAFFILRMGFTLESGGSES
ncbi:MAG: flippase-like domain-containing protein [Rhodothermales bacterium]|nr:flippase-like domain-containing protein [Rhodothermales bacterium]